MWGWVARGEAPQGCEAWANARSKLLGPPWLWLWALALALVLALALPLALALALPLALALAWALALALSVASHRADTADRVRTLQQTESRRSRQDKL